MIDTAFTFALLLSLLKVGEMILRPHQKKWIQSQLEEITLQLDTKYSSYENWIAVLPRLSCIYVFLFGGAGAITCALIATHVSSDAVMITAVAASYLFILVGASAGLWSHAPRVLIEWGWGPKSLGLGAIPVVIGGIFASLAVYLILKYLGILLLLMQLNSRWRARRLYFTLSAFPGIVLTAVLAYWAFWLAKPFVRLLIAILWRIIEFQSGAWMAILFLLTTALGIAQRFFAAPTY